MQLGNTLVNLRQKI
ncbi:hypothetical protein OIU76_030506, partial [Salix suchowensis]